MNYRRNATTKRERPLRTSVLPDKDQIVLLMEGPKFSCDHEALFAGQHEKREVDVSEFRVESVTPSWNKIYIFCSLGYLSVNQKKAFLGALWGWGNRLLM